MGEFNGTGPSVAYLIRSIPGIPQGLDFRASRRSRGYVAIGAHGFEGHLRTPLDCDRLDDFLGEVDKVIKDYQEHLWSILKRD